MITLSAPRADWETAFGAAATALRGSLGSLALHVDHIGSTSVPDLVAKDVIDIQVITRSLTPRAPLIAALAEGGYEHSQQSWNFRDHLPSQWSGDPAAWDKLVMQGHDGERPINVHLRVVESPNERYALLFRDFLRADAEARQGWARFKIQLAAAVPDLETYGAVKDPATDVLMCSAERWAASTRWSVERSRSA